MIGLETFALAGLLAAGTPAAPPVALPAARPLALERYLAPEQPTVFLFFKPSSSLERDFVRGLRESAGSKVGLREIYLRSGDEALAQRYQVAATPTALVYDRRGRLVGRSSTAAEILALTARAAQVMRIDWAEPSDPRFAEMEKVLGRPGNSGIMRTMSLRPEWLRKINELHRMEHAPDTALDRRTKEMIATYVSALNKCRFCVGAHARNLQLQGQDSKDVDAIGQGRIEQSAITEKERALLDYVKVLTLEPASVRDAHVERLRAAGWNDEQIFEASFVTSMFAFFNRMADAYGLDYPPGRWLPPDLRAPAPGARK